MERTHGDMDPNERTAARSSHKSGPAAGAPAPQTLSPQQGAEALVELGVNRHSLRVDVLFLKAVWGGIFLSYGGMLEAVVAGSMWEMTNNAGILRLLEGLVFPVGLAMIVLTGTSLLTSDMMTIFLSSLKGRTPWWSVPYVYFVVFWGNLAGSLFFAAILVRYSNLINSDAINSFIVNTATTRATTAWHALFLRGIGCNIMVNMSVYLASMALGLGSKVVGIWIPLSTFVALQFEHVVADMFTIPMGMMRGADISVGRYVGTPMMAALIGNIVGALLLGISLYWFYLHDTSASMVHSNRDEEATLHDNGHGHAHGHGGKVGPFGRGTFGNPMKVQGRTQA